MDKQKLLLVDDVPENLHVLYQTLKDEYDVRSVTSGVACLHVAESLLPDLILLDVMMPEMDGFAVCKRLKESEKLSDIPVIFLTALAEDFNEVRGFEVGAVDYILKPFKPLVVKKRVETQLTIKNQRDLLIKSNNELNEALDKIKVLSGLVPICMYCKKIRDDDGFWNHLESYISEHSNILFSHGMCPECGEKVVSELNNFK